MDKTLVDDESDQRNIENGEIKVEEDTLTKAIGEFGRWQIFLITILALTSQISAGWNMMGIIFLAPKTTFQCLTRINAAEETLTGVCYEDCVQYEYITDFSNSIITEFELICEKAWLSNLAQTVFMFGVLIGSIIFGFIADRYGRRKAVLSASMMHLVFSLILPLCPEYWSFVTVRFFLGTTTAGLMMIIFVIIVEITGPSCREIIASAFHVPFITAQMIMPVIAYWLRSWRSFALGIAVPNFLFLFYTCLIPESPRWLVSVGRIEEASEIMKNIAKRNKLPTSNMLGVAETMADESNNKVSEQTTVSYVDLITNPSLRIKNLFSCMSWAILGLGYYGGSQYIGQTSWNVFITISLAGMLQIISMVGSGYLIKFFGRRYVIIGLLLVNSLCNGLLALPEDWRTLKIIVSALSVSSCAGAFNAMYVFTSELFPTVARNMAMGSSSTMSRLGSMLAPFVAGTTQGAWIPPLVFAVMPLVAAAGCWALPETKGKKLMNRLVD